MTKIDFTTGKLTFGGHDYFLTSLKKTDKTTKVDVTDSSQPTVKEYLYGRNETSITAELWTTVGHIPQIGVELELVLYFQDIVYSGFGEFESYEVTAQIDDAVKLSLVGTYSEYSSSPILSGMLAGWKGGTLADVTENGYTITAINAPIVETSGIGNMSQYTFNGTNQCLSSFTNTKFYDLNINNSNWSMAFWIKTNSSGSYSPAYWSYADGNVSFDQLNLGPLGDRIIFNSEIIISNYDPDNSYQLYALTYTNSEKLLNVYRGDTSSPGAWNPATSSFTYTGLDGDFAGNFNIGYVGDSGTEGIMYLSGSVGDFYIWNRILTQDEMVILWNTGSSAQYPFNV